MPHMSLLAPPCLCTVLAHLLHATQKSWKRKGVFVWEIGQQPKNAHLLLLRRQRKRVRNATNERYYAESISVMVLSLPVISKPTFQRQRRHKLSNNITQNKGTRGTGTILSMMLTARRAESNVSLFVCLP